MYFYEVVKTSSATSEINVTPLDFSISNAAAYRASLQARLAIKDWMEALEPGAIQMKQCILCPTRGPRNARSTGVRAFFNNWNARTSMLQNMRFYEVVQTYSSTLEANVGPLASLISNAGAHPASLHHSNADNRRLNGVSEAGRGQNEKMLFLPSTWAKKCAIGWSAGCF